jgi:signal recognition particle receptor subunit beta
MYNATRQLVLRGADGLIFIVDSQWDRMEANIESLRNLEENLASLDLKPEQLTWMLFYNKRDLPEEQIAPTDAIDLLIRAPERKVDRLAGDCVTGRNVFKTLNLVTQKVLRDFLLKDDLENYEAYR